jgi:hypothetical protein
VKPAIFASVYKYEGQLQVYLPTRIGYACAACGSPRDGLVGNCAQAGVWPGAGHAWLRRPCRLKILLGMPGEVAPTVHMFDLLEMHWRTLKASRNPACDHEARLDPSLPAEQAAPLVLELDFDSLNAARASGRTLLDIRESWERALDDPEQQIELHVPLSRSPRAMHPHCRATCAT